jgi:hypothetical protein
VASFRTLRLVARGMEARGVLGLHVVHQELRLALVVACRVAGVSLFCAVSMLLISWTSASKVVSRDCTWRPWIWSTRDCPLAREVVRRVAVIADGNLAVAPRSGNKAGHPSGSWSCPPDADTIHRGDTSDRRGQRIQRARPGRSMAATSSRPTVHVGQAPTLDACRPWIKPERQLTAAAPQFLSAAEPTRQVALAAALTADTVVQRGMGMAWQVR